MERTEILKQLNALKTVDDLAVLLDAIKQDEFGKIRYGITASMLKHFSSDKIAPKRFRIFHIRKRSGGLREIKAPCRQLDVILTCLNVMLKACYEPSDAAMGFTSGKSVLNNAQVHVGHNYVFNIDLKDFFPSIPQARVWKRLQLPPFNFCPDIANVVAGICCAFDENVQQNVLPQGSPASPLLTNAICDKLDRRMKGVAKRFGLHYSRYADDMTFSSMHNVYQENSPFRVEIQRIIEEQGFRMNDKKTRLQKDGARQEVTGLTVNAIANVSRQYISDLRWLLHVWEREGYAKAYALFYPKYKHEKGYIKKGEPVMENVIGGKLDYLRMIRGEHNPAYQKLQSRYNALQQLVFTDNETDKSKSYVYVQPYTMEDFQNLFHTTVALSVTREGKLVGKCEIDSREKTLAISKSTQKILCPNLESRHAGDNISSDELSKCFVTLCRNKGKNFWLITQFEPKRSRCLSIQNLNVSPEDILKLWGTKGLTNAVEELTLYIQFANPNDSILDWNPLANSENTMDRGAFNFTKEDIITFFLKNKNVTNAQRKRAMQLMMANAPAHTEGDGVNEKLTETKKPSNNVLHKLHVPKEVSNFLASFTKAETALRYVTHNWDADQFDGYDAFEKQYIRDIMSHELWSSSSMQGKDNRQLYLASNRLYYLIYNFLLSDECKIWHAKPNLSIGFKSISSYIREWMTENQGSQPWDMPLYRLPEEIRPQKPIGGKIPLIFGNVIDVFRESICFKGQEFYYLVRQIFKRGEFVLDEDAIETLRGVSFYTDTQRVEDAICRVAKNCLDYKQFTHLKITCGLKDSVYTFTILQSDSFADCSYNSDKLQLRGKGDLIDIKKSLQSLCDFSIRSRFRNENGELATAIISYLYDPDFEKAPKITWSNETCEGFEYIFKFYLA